jgi:hypothetical protein
MDERDRRLTRTGQMRSQKRQEFIMASDVLEMFAFGFDFRANAPDGQKGFLIKSLRQGRR